jgi:hypothetical protein
MTDRLNSKDVFVQAVADELAGTPHANHPVQFEAFPGIMIRCTLCHAAVPEGFQDDHRDWHDAHVRVHDDILDEALRYKSPPRYGGSL